MTIVEVVLLNTILIVFPLILYLFYLAYSKSLSVEIRNLFLDIALYSSFYLTLKFPIPDLFYVNLLVLNIPLLVAYLKGRKLSIILLTMMIILCYYNVFHWNIIILLFEYLFYYLLSLFLLKKTGKNYFYATIFLLFKLILFTMLITISHDGIHHVFWINFLYYGFHFILIGYFVIIVFHKGNEIIKMHMTLKEIKQEEQIKTSLFKITHEIKNPIAVCKGYLDMFDVNNIEHSRKYIPIIKDEIERTLFLLQDFLSMTRVTIEKEMIDVNLLLEDVMSSYQLLLHSHNIKLDVDLIDDEIYINGDYNRLLQVFLNIVKNSIEAIENNGKITVNTKLVDHNIVVKITDNGCGIKKEDLKQIRIPFFTTKQRGTGLGVSLSYEIIEAHNGTIQYESEYGKGTLVTVSLPLLEEL